jgi:ABC-type sulfate/molybdate transport systems ATPase subunit
MIDVEAKIEVKNLQLSLAGNIAVDGVSHVFQLKKNIGIVGETGSGKSSLLRLIAGLEQADNGTVIFNEERVLGANEKLIPGHPKIAYLSQHYELRNNYRIEEILSYNNLIEDEAAVSIYKLCEIDHLYKRWSDELSGGEKQRVALASLLTQEPEVLLLDEPFSNLDVIHKRKLLSLLRNIQTATGVSLITVSHDVQDILSWSDEIIIMQKGKIVQSGTPDIVYHQPINEYCAALLGYYQLLNTKNQMLLAFPKMNAINGEKSLFIRPGYFTLTENKHNSLSGIVKNIEFFGNYYLIEVLVVNMSIMITSATKSKSVGEEVFLASSIDKYWFL